MQQTEKYQLNKIDMDDTFSTVPLNENMDKVEAAMDGFDQQLTDLPIQHIATGTFHPATNLEVYTGFRPKAVITHSVSDAIACGVFIPDETRYVSMTDTGFTINSCSTNSIVMSVNYNYIYVALG